MDGATNFGFWCREQLGKVSDRPYMLSTSLVSQEIITAAEKHGIIRKGKIPGMYALTAFGRAWTLKHVGAGR